MSDLMLLGVLQMPIEMVMSDSVSTIQYIHRGHEAAKRIKADADLIEQQAARIAELEAQIATVAPAVDAQPVAWRIFDGEGGYDYRDEPPPEVNVAWAAKHGRKYEPLYTEPQSSQSTQSEPVAWANVKDDGTIVGLSQHPGDIANWQNPRPLCYQCKGCGDSEYGPWRCSRCEGSGFESAPNAAQSEGLRKDAGELLRRIPRTPEQMIDFIGSHFDSMEAQEWSEFSGEARAKPAGDLSMVRYSLTVHDLLSAFDWADLSEYAIDAALSKHTGEKDD